MSVWESFIIVGEQFPQIIQTKVFLHFFFLIDNATAERLFVCLSLEYFLFYAASLDMRNNKNHWI